jgi:LysM repeat protein
MNSSPGLDLVYRVGAALVTLAIVFIIKTFLVHLDIPVVEDPVLSLEVAMMSVILTYVITYEVFSGSEHIYKNNTPEISKHRKKQDLGLGQMVFLILASFAGSMAIYWPYWAYGNAPKVPNLSVASPVSPDMEPAKPTAAAPGTYMIERGDTLAKIATKLYGDSEKWRMIAQANPGLNPDRLKVGQEIKLPDLPIKQKQD